MTDAIIQSIRYIRKDLNLQSKQEIISVLNSHIRKIADSKEYPDYAKFYLEKGLLDVQNSENENTLLVRVAEWISAANSENDIDKRSVIAQIGAVIMSVSFDK